MNVSDLMSRSPGPAAPGLVSSTDSNITLWQFLLELLQQEQNGDIIEWTRGAEGEFRLIDAEAVARKWGQRKAKPHMNYDKLSRALRYYYEKNIIKKVIGKKFVYRFVTDVNSSPEYQQLKLCYVKDEKDLSHDPAPFLTPVSSHRTDFSALSLMSTEPSTTAHSISTPSPTDSVCSPSSSIASSATANLSTSPTPSTSSPVEDPTNGSRQNRKRSLSPVSSSTMTSTSNTVPSSSEPTLTKLDQPPPVKKGMKPNPLNLTATSNFVVPPISPLLMLQHQNSPLFQSSLGQLYAIASASLASAGLYGPQMSPLLQSQSPFRSPLTTPKTMGMSSITEIGGPNRTPSSEAQVFQFPPVSAFQQNSLISSFTNLISPIAPFMMPSQSSTSFKFPSSTDSLKTPTVPIKMPTL